jgi:hypothetical protein
MKRAAISGAFLILVAVLFGGCTKYYAKTKPLYLPQNSPIKLNVTQPATIINVSSCTPGSEELLGRWFGMFVVASRYDFTESTIGIVKEFMQRNHLPIDDKAEKRLELSIDAATCEFDGLEYSANVTLKVKTGSGLQRRYHSRQYYRNDFRTTSAFEMAMEQCVERMLMDKDIVDYLEK